VPRLKGTERVAGRFYPLIDVTLRLPGGGSVPLLAELDSGADITTVPAEYLADTGIDYDSLQPVPAPAMTAGGAVEMRVCPCQIWYEKWKVCDWFLVIAPGKMPDPMALLGRDDFFKRFTVYFDWSQSPPIFDIRRVK
jgi:hypothetical protein